MVVNQLVVTGTSRVIVIKLLFYEDRHEYFINFIKKSHPVWQVLMDGKNYSLVPRLPLALHFFHFVDTKSFSRHFLWICVTVISPRISIFPYAPHWS